ncbi:MAG: extracellular solute-binding protein, partial [Firmicutes bacterium]|nr:extracellular solute-binding protein [Bacillota bacterium]
MYKKSFLTLFLILVFASSLVNAAIVEIWQASSNEQIAIMNSFIEEKFTPQTGIKINISAMPGGSDQWNKVLLAMASNDTPDLAVIGSEWPLEFGIRGGLVDMREMFQEEYDKIFNTAFPGLNESLDYYGTGFGLNASFGQTLTFYRTDIFAENGWEVPATWDEVRTLLPKMQANGMNVGSSSWYLTPDWFGAYIFMWQHGIREVNADRTKTTWDSPEAINAFTEFTELFTKHGIPTESVPFIEAMSRGDYPFLVGISWGYSDITLGAPNLKGKWDLCLIPGTKREDGTINHAAYVGGNPYVMFKNSQNKEEAFEFLKWWLSAGIQREFADMMWNQLHIIRQPANMEAYNTLSFLPESHRQILNTQAEAS